MTLEIGKSLVYDFSRDIKDVLVADPKIANAMILSSRRAYIIGNATGETNIIFFDAEGKQMASFEITVTDAKSMPPSRDVSNLSGNPKLIPGARDVNVESVGDGIILTGTVASQAGGAAGLRHRSAFRRSSERLQQQQRQQRGSVSGSGRQQQRSA